MAMNRYAPPRARVHSLCSMRSCGGCACGRREGLRVRARVMVRVRSCVCVRARMRRSMAGLRSSCCLLRTGKRHATRLAGVHARAWMRVCVYIYYVYMYVYIMYIYIASCYTFGWCACPRVDVCVCVCVCVPTATLLKMGRSVCPRRVRVCMHKCMYVCMHAFTHWRLYIDICTHTHTHTHTHI